ncbi:MAG TPA: FAD-dependent oxidoreductase [Dehalococcoidia bacterium]|nr:FAD-dependent oxidoreductase [Dehalococcoidia bacterium]
MTSGNDSWRDAAIVGGGIAGCLTAYLLAKEGLKVTVIEADAVGSHASGFAFGEMNDLEGAGIPDPLLEFSLWCNRRHRTLAEELREVSGIDNQYRRVNRLSLAFDLAAVHHLKEDLAWQQEVEEYKSVWLETDAVLKVESRVNPRCLGGVYVENATSLEPYRYTLAAAQAAEKLGVEVVLRRVTGLLAEGDRCRGVTFENGQVRANLVLLTMGPWASLAGEWCGVNLPVIPLKGQMLRLQHPGEPIKASLHYGSSYVASKPDGLIWAGTTEERVGFDEVPTLAARDRIMAELVHFAPFLADARLVRQTACLRPWSKDGMPIVAQVPGWQNLYLGTGGGRKGILWSTGICQGLTDLILRGQSDIPGLNHLDLARFAQD